MAKEGWISLHRPIQEHWIWKDPCKFQWWIDILLTVNNSDAKVNIGNQVFTCKRGESLLSLQSWASRWHVSKDTARNFLKLLEKDKMVVLGALHGTDGVISQKSTRLTVCKYDDYQTSLHVNRTHSVRTLYTNNKGNNEDNLESSIDADFSKPKKSATQLLKDTFDQRKSEFRKTLIPHTNTPKNPEGKFDADMVKEFYEKWTEPNKSRSKMKFELEDTWDVALRLGTWKRNGFGVKKSFDKNKVEYEAVNANDF